MYKNTMRKVAMKSYIYVVIQFFIHLSAMANPIKEVFKVEGLSITSMEYPFLKWKNAERTENDIRFDLGSKQDQVNVSPLVLLPEGIVCIRRKVLNIGHSTDLNWIVKLFDEPLIIEEKEEVMEISHPEGDFVIRCDSFDLLCYFYERPNKTYVMSVIRMDMVVELNGKVYFVGSLPSIDDKFSWRQTYDERIADIANILVLSRERVPEKLVLPYK